MLSGFSGRLGKTRDTKARIQEWSVVETSQVARVCHNTEPGKVSVAGKALIAIAQALTMTLARQNQLS